MDLSQARAGHGDTAAYLLGALNETQRVQFEAHVAGCAACLHELEELRSVSDHLALAVAQVDPPAALKARLLRRAQEVLPAIRVAPPAPPAVPESLLAAERTRRLRWWHLSERLAAAITAAALALGLVASGVGFSAHLESQRTAAAAAELADALSIVYQPNMIWRTLTGTDQAPQSKGRLCLNPGGVEAVLMAYDLPRLPSHEVYQLWLNNPEEQQRESGGIFRVDERGRGHVIVRLHSPLGRFQTAGVTREPEKGSPAPTGPRVLAGQL